MILAIDVGTSSARAGLYDHAGRAVPGRFFRVPYQPTTTPDGGMEHDPHTLLESTARCVDAVLHGQRASEIAGVGVSTFWHGLLGFAADGRPATPVYMWADTRSAPEASLLQAALDEEALHARTGCHLHASYWPAKLRWLARERPAELRRVTRWGSLGEHLELSLFGQAETSLSMASASGLLDQDRLDWDDEALAAAQIEPDQLFPVRDRTESRRGLREPWASRWPVLRRVPWFPAIGDGAASNVGSDCTDPSRIAVNVGTSAALRVVTRQAGPPPRGLWRYRLDRLDTIIGGATSEGGNVYAWCRQTLSLPSPDTVERELTALLPDAHGLTVLPFLAGERSPGWRGDQRATITGLTIDTTPVEILRAALESVAFRIGLVYELLAPRAASGHGVVLSGGAVTASRVWTQMITDTIGRTVTWSPEPEATSRGAALLALQALGLLTDLAAARAPAGEAFEPDAARRARYREAMVRQRRLDETMAR
jgi:gluconokinase